MERPFALDDVTDYAREYALAHARAFGMEAAELATFLKDRFGRPAVALITGTSDVNGVSRWASGRVAPELSRVQKMRDAFIVHQLLARIFAGEDRAAAWFTGENQLLNGDSPASSFKQGNVSSVYHVVRSLYGVLEDERARTAQIGFSL